MNSFFVVLNNGLMTGLILVPAVFAMMISLRIIDFPDLSIEGSFPLGAAVAGLLIKNGVPLFFSIGLALAAGSFAGILTGIIHEKLKVSKLLSGIIVLTMFYSINLRVMGGSNISLLGQNTMFTLWENLDYLYETKLGWNQFVLFKNGFLFFIMLFIAGIVYFLLQSRFGLRLQAVGSNRIFSDRMGLRTSMYIIGILALTNLLSAFSGALMAMHQGFADVGMGHGVLVMTIASLAIGEKLSSIFNWKNRISFLVLSVIVGSILYQIIISAAIRAGLAASDLKIATAVLVLTAVAFHFYRKDEIVEEHGY
jgi:putative tryptophan/tyrosine transport system permease protein